MNASGINPVEYKCLVLPTKIEEMTAGGIVLPTQVQEQDQLAETKGVLVAVGGMAFSDWEGARPVVGQRVMIAKYAGLLCKGADGEEYRLVSDKDIAATLDDVKQEKQP